MTRVVAIVPWGDVIEDYLDPIGVTLEAFAGEMSGGWLFGYVEALQAVGWAPFVLVPSSRVEQPRRLVHAATGCAIWLVPGRTCQKVGNPELRAVRQWLTTPVQGMAKVLRNQRCDLLLVQDYERPQFDALVRLGRTMGIPVFATFQGGDHIQSRVERLVRRRTIRRSAGLIVAASAERARVDRDYGLGAGHVAAIPNPVDLELWSPLPRSDARAALGIEEAAFVAVTHGRIDIHRKGLDLLLAAWRGPGLLVLIGSGQDRDRLAAMIEDRSDVRWIDGYTNDRQFIRRWLSAADLYVSASRLEGMPVAPIEAMACGLPVVASTAKGLEDIFPADLPAGGLLFPNGDVAALSAAVDRLRDDPALRQRLGEAGREVAGRRFSIAAVGQSLRQFLERGVDPG
ncbi:glycosyltransferase family 4 protein [Sphingomonas sp. LHG3406-1]|uniref:glycosyltransferase family 4 protein n=1 Tax=Sphingomonas sp. LHG3406-1 TaxID=2804617 RepID=UPI00262632D7|nr:glycosyltransferase family 4 protein [Sphingomonas sp. LHG3406-1]